MEEYIGYRYNENREIHLLAEGCYDFNTRATDKYLSENSVY